MLWAIVVHGAIAAAGNMGARRAAVMATTIFVSCLKLASLGQVSLLLLPPTYCTGDGKVPIWSVP